MLKQASTCAPLRISVPNMLPLVRNFPSTPNILPFLKQNHSYIASVINSFTHLYRSFLSYRKRYGKPAEGEIPDLRVGLTHELPPQRHDIGTSCNRRRDACLLNNPVRNLLHFREQVLEALRFKIVLLGDAARRMVGEQFHFV